MSALPSFTVIVVTHNRSALLRRTLAALARLTYSGRWCVMVVDNDSTDDTQTAVRTLKPGYPVPLSYHFEGTPGKYWALNAGIAAAETDCIAATDDDATPAADWLERAADGLTAGWDFVGGRVYPEWSAPPPRWIDGRSALSGKVLGLQDHGDEKREYGRGGLSWPLGVNVAYRRDVFRRVGLFSGELGRVAGTLRNQSQREWHLRARACGLRGVYLPRMVVHHNVEAERVSRAYFLRWFYWHGISRAILYQRSGLHLLEPENTATHARERHVLGVPSSIWRGLARTVISVTKRWVTGRWDEAVEYELHLAFCAGVIRQRFVDAVVRRQPRPTEARISAPKPPATPAGDAGAELPAVRELINANYSRAD